MEKTFFFLFFLPSKSIQRKEKRKRRRWAFNNNNNKKQFSNDKAQENKKKKDRDQGEKQRSFSPYLFNELFNADVTAATQVFNWSQNRKCIEVGKKEKEKKKAALDSPHVELTVYSPFNARDNQKKDKRTQKKKKKEKRKCIMVGNQPW